MSTYAKAHSRHVALARFRSCFAFLLVIPEGDLLLQLFLQLPFLLVIPEGDLLLSLQLFVLHIVILTLERSEVKNSCISSLFLPLLLNI
jgi:hypothetical protein